MQLTDRLKSFDFSVITDHAHRNSLIHCPDRIIWLVWIFQLYYSETTALFFFFFKFDFSDFKILTKSNQIFKIFPLRNHLFFRQNIWTWVKRSWVWRTPVFDKTIYPVPQRKWIFNATDSNTWKANCSCCSH